MSVCHIVGDSNKSQNSNENFSNKSSTWLSPFCLPRMSQAYSYCSDGNDGTYFQWIDYYIEVDCDFQLHLTLWARFFFKATKVTSSICITTTWWSREIFLFFNTQNKLNISSALKKNVIPFYCILMAIRSFSEKKKCFNTMTNETTLLLSWRSDWWIRWRYPFFDLYCHFC